MANQQLGIGIIGAGNIVKRHALAYRALPGIARLTAIADISTKRAEAAKLAFGFKHALGDYHEMLTRDDVDVVDVCTPAHLHARMVIDAIDAGKHVICEKPMATTLAEADDIIAAADRHPNQTVSFVFQLRTEAAHRRMRLMIEKGLIGRVLTASLSVRLKKKPGYYTSVPGRGSWKTDGGGVLINQAIHQLDALISFLGEPVVVSSVMDTFVQPIEAEDTIAGWVKFKSGAIATIDCTVCAHSKTFWIDVLGENAACRIGGNPDADAFDWKIKASGSAAQKALSKQAQELSPTPVNPGGGAVAIQKLQAKIKRRPWIPPAHWGHTPCVKAFLEAAGTGAPGPIPPREARRSLELAAALYESAITREPVSLPIDSTSSVYHGVQSEDTSNAPAANPTESREPQAAAGAE